MKFSLILKYFLLWQVLLLVIVAASQDILPLRETYLGGATQAYVSNPLLYSRANFDGEHYIKIAKWGYGYAQQAFFPLYPNLIRSLTRTFKNPVISGVLISNLSFLVSLIFLARLIRLDYDVNTTKFAIIALLLFPTSFYFGSVYTEGLFFLLGLSSFYAARRSRWWLASILGALAAYTRFVGIFLFPALLVEFWLQHKEIKNLKLKIKNLVPILLIPLGLLIYMSYLQRTTGDPFAFFNAIKLFGQHKGEKVILLYQVFWRYIKMVATVNRSDPLYFTIWMEFLAGIGFLVLSIYSFIKQRLSYAVFNFLAYIVPTLTGTFTSLPRYVLLCFPSFILLGQLLARHPRWRPAIIVISFLILIAVQTLFSRGYWVG